jgi:epsilon-lactone hydrolase
MLHPRLAVLSLALAVALAPPLWAQSPAGFEETAAAQAAANKGAGPRKMPGHAIPVPSDEVSPQLQALIAGPYPPQIAQFFDRHLGR